MKVKNIFIKKLIIPPYNLFIIRTFFKGHKVLISLEVINLFQFYLFRTNGRMIFLNKEDHNF